MDLSNARFDRFDRAREVAPPVRTLDLFVASASARQAASPTAAIQAGFGAAVTRPALFAPVDGAFNGSMARVLIEWKEA